MKTIRIYHRDRPYTLEVDTRRTEDGDCSVAIWQGTEFAGFALWNEDNGFDPDGRPTLEDMGAREAAAVYRHAHRTLRRAVR